MMNRYSKKYICVLALLICNIPLVANANYLLTDGVPNPMNYWAPLDYGGNVIDPINGEAPQNWLTAKAIGLPAYYVDNVHPNATDSGNPFGSPDKPRKTILEGTYDAGSYVEIHGGPYSGGGQLIITANGTPDKPVWIRGVDSDNRALISGETIIKGKYVILENLEYRTSGRTISFRTHSGSMLHHAVVRNSLFYGDGQDSGAKSVIGIYGSPDKRFHDIVVFNNDISNFGNNFDDVPPESGLTNENDYHGVMPSSNVDRVWVIKNKIYNLGGDSIQVGTASIPDEYRPSNTYIADNDFYSNLENGVDVKEADSTLIINNRIWDWKKHKNNSSTGAAVVIHNKAKNTWIINNKVHDAAVGVAVSDGSLHTWVIGNVIADVSHPSWEDTWSGGLYDAGGGIHFRGGSSGGALNNTIFSYDKGIEASNGDYVFINNILYDRNVEAGRDIFVESTQSNFLISNNLLYSDKYNASLYNATCLSCIYAEPEFVSLVPNDASVMNSSVVLGKGLSITHYLGLFKEIFGTEITKDIYQKDRVVGGIDIGAFEHQESLSGFEGDPPVAPSISTILVQ
jgi:hypothetical protein